MVPGFSPQTSAAIESFNADAGLPETQAALQTAAEGPQVQGAILAPAAEGAPTSSPDFYVNRPAPQPLQQVLNYTQVVALRGEAATTRCSMLMAGNASVQAGLAFRSDEGSPTAPKAPPLCWWCSSRHMTGSSCKGALPCCGHRRFPSRQWQATCHVINNTCIDGFLTAGATSLRC